MDDYNWARLAEAVRERRLKVGLSTRGAATAAGINRATWAAVEEEKTRLSEHLWVAIERALSWSPGSIRSILAGGRPTVADPTPTLPDGFDLQAELERINRLDEPGSRKLAAARALIEMYEQAQAERRAGPTARPA